MKDDSTDPVLTEFRRCHLFNNEYDRVKVVSNTIQFVEFLFLDKQSLLGYFPS